MLAHGVAHGHVIAALDAKALGVDVGNHDDWGALVREGCGALDGRATKQRARCDQAERAVGRSRGRCGDGDASRRCRRSGARAVERGSIAELAPGEAGEGRIVGSQSVESLGGHRVCRDLEEAGKPTRPLDQRHTTDGCKRWADTLYATLEVDDRAIALVLDVERQDDLRLRGDTIRKGSNGDDDLGLRERHLPTLALGALDHGVAANQHDCLDLTCFERWQDLVPAADKANGSLAALIGPDRQRQDATVGLIEPEGPGECFDFGRCNVVGDNQHRARCSHERASQFANLGDVGTSVGSKRLDRTGRLGVAAHVRATRLNDSGGECSEHRRAGGWQRAEELLSVGLERSATRADDREASAATARLADA